MTDEAKSNGAPGNTWRLRALLACGAVLVAACGEPEDTGPGRPVAHRRAAFVTMLKAFEPMGIDLRAGDYVADRFISQAEAFAKVKDEPWQYFVDGSNYPPTHATRRVWEDPQGFAAARQKFLDASDDLVAAAATRDRTRAVTAYELLQDSCRSCHQRYKR